MLGDKIEVLQGKVTGQRVLPQIKTLLVVALFTFVLPTTTWGVEVSQFHSRGKEAFAIFSEFDDCIVTAVIVNVGNFREHEPPGPADTTANAMVNIFTFDLCTGTSLFDAFGFTEVTEEDFEIADKLTSASLNVSLQLTDSVSGVHFNVDVAINWTGEGDLFRGNSHSNLLSPGLKIHSHRNGTDRDAIATGSVSDGITNFITRPSGFAFLSSSNVGQLEIVK